MSDTATRKKAEKEILIVDDNPANLRLLADLLMNAGYRVRPASDGPLALESIAARLPDLVILDIKMPDMDGYEVCRRLKSEEPSRKIPVIFISALSDLTNKVEGFTVGGVDYISKPFEQEEVLARVRIHLRLKELTEHLEREIEERTAALSSANAHLRQEIAERKTVEKALRESEERYRVLFEDTTEGILIADVETKAFVYANPAICEMLGYPVEELLSKSVYDIHPKQNIDEVIAEFEMMALKEETLSSELACLRKDGRVIYADVKTSTITLKKRACNVGFFTDVTEQRLMKKQLTQSQKMESIGTLAGGIAHDFNNILAAMIGYAEMSLEEVKDNPTVFRNLQQVLNAGDRAKELVQQILTFSRQTKQELKPIQVRIVIKEVLKLLRATMPATIEIAQDLQSDAAVLADLTQLHQVIMNICTNAGHAMRTSGGMLAIRLDDVVLDPDFCAGHPGTTPGCYLKMVISDTGCGMSAELLDRIFEPFFTTKEKGEGTGMGLAVVHGIVKSHGGTITVSSESGRGSAFTVYFPVIASENIPAETSDWPLHRGTERILFVDDELPIAEVGKLMLQSLGYQVVTATSSVDALAIFREHASTFDLVITDMTMPQMTGDKLATAILDIRSDTPIILTTGFSNQINEAKARLMGIRALITKPVNRNELAMIVRSVLGKAWRNVLRD
jgi:PAS domain S-box-containing protein